MLLGEGRQPVEDRPLAAPRRSTTLDPSVALGTAGPRVSNAMLNRLSASATLGRYSSHNRPPAHRQSGHWSAGSNDTAPASAATS